MTKLFNFRKSEFTCKCGCGKNYISKSLMYKLETAREIAGIPFIVTSGYRCEKHNKNVGGVPNSTHTRGLASDIKYSNDNELFCIVNGLIKAGFLRILIYPKRKFVHVDIDYNLRVRIIKIME